MNNFLEDLSTLKLPPLAEGAHILPEYGLCAMEMVAYMERLEHSDSPACTCPVIAAYVRQLNDLMPAEEREKLKPYLSRLVGTVSSQHTLARAEYFAWAAIRQFAPIALRASGINAEADLLEHFSGTLADAARAANAIRADAAAANAAADAAATANAIRAAANAAADAAAANAIRADAAAANAIRADADAAADAARAAAYAAANAAANDACAAHGGNSGNFDLALEVLDGALKIGPSTGFTNYTTERAKKLETIGE